jgi:hypothetical protein
VKRWPCDPSSRYRDCGIWGGRGSAPAGAAAASRSLAMALPARACRAANWTSTAPRAAQPDPSRGPAPDRARSTAEYPSFRNVTSDGPEWNPSRSCFDIASAVAAGVGVAHRPSRRPNAASRPAVRRRCSRTATSTAPPSAAGPTPALHTLPRRAEPRPDRHGSRQPRRVRGGRLPEVGRRETGVRRHQLRVLVDDLREHGRVERRQLPDRRKLPASSRSSAITFVIAMSIADFGVPSASGTPIRSRR